MKGLVSLHQEYKRHLPAAAHNVRLLSYMDERGKRAAIFAEVSRMTKYDLESKLYRLADSARNTYLFDFSLLPNKFYIQKLLEYAPDNPRAKFQLLSIRIRELIDQFNRDNLIWIDGDFIQEVQALLEELKKMKVGG